MLSHVLRRDASRDGARVQVLLRERRPNPSSFRAGDWLYLKDVNNNGMSIVD